MIIKAFQESNQPNIYKGIAATLGLGISSVVSSLSLASLEKELATTYVRKERNRLKGNVGQETVETRNIFYLKDMMNNIVTVMSSLARLYFPMGYLHSSVPAAVIAGIPLGTVEALSHAMSANDLKFRSKGGIFLAHQEGGEQTLRIEGKAFGPNRFILLIMLDFLFRYGSSTVVDMFESHLKTGVNKFYEFVPMSASADPWQPLNKFALNEGKGELHKTFPVITLQRVYTSMYIETWEFSRSIEKGLNCINFTLFFRKFRPLPPEKYGIMFDDTGKIQVYYKQDTDDELYKKLNRLDFSLEFALSLALLTFRAILILSGNSLERNVAMTTALAIHESILGRDQFEDVLKSRITGLSAEDSLSGYSIENKEELMQLG